MVMVGEKTGLSTASVAGICCGGVALVGISVAGWQWYRSRADKETEELKMAEEVSAPLTKDFLSFCLVINKCFLLLAQGKRRKKERH